MSYKTKEEIARLNEPLLRQNREDLAKELELNWSEFYKRTVSSPEAYKSENGKTLQNIVGSVMNHFSALGSSAKDSLKGVQHNFKATKENISKTNNKLNLVGKVTASSTVLPAAIARGNFIDKEATKPSKVLAGLNIVWSKEARDLAQALAYNNQRLEEYAKKKTEVSKKVDYTELDKKVTESNLENYMFAEYTPIEHYNMLVHLNKLDTLTSKHEAYLNSIDEDMWQAIFDYAFDNRDVVADFGGTR